MPCMDRRKAIAILISIGFVVGGFLMVATAVDTSVNAFERAGLWGALEPISDSVLVILVGSAMLIAGIASLCYFIWK